MDYYSIGFQRTLSSTLDVLINEKSMQYTNKACCVYLQSHHLLASPQTAAAYDGTRRHRDTAELSSLVLACLLPTSVSCLSQVLCLTHCCVSLRCCVSSIVVSHLLLSHSSAVSHLLLCLTQLSLANERSRSGSRAQPTALDNGAAVLGVTQSLHCASEVNIFTKTPHLPLQFLDSRFPSYSLPSSTITPVLTHCYAAVRQVGQPPATWKSVLTQAGAGVWCSSNIVCRYLGYK
ncbi:hypothetical protein FHG87_006710 [Trinorchestia longiramus]|nr:hypothetical protein FHG87_006710 [Trinorchestia longiramus]